MVDGAVLARRADRDLIALRGRNELGPVGAARVRRRQIDEVVERDDAPQETAAVDVRPEPRPVDVRRSGGRQQYLSRVRGRFALDGLGRARPGDDELAVISVNEEQRETAGVDALRDSQSHGHPAGSSRPAAR